MKNAKCKMTRWVLGILLFAFSTVYFPLISAAAESLIIAASPSLKEVLSQLGAAFEQSHPDVRVKLYLASGLDLRQTIAAMENSMVGQYFIGKGPVHLIAPGGDELIARFEQKYYVLPGTKRSYAMDRLVVVVPESLVQAPESLEEMSRSTTRLAVADPSDSRLGSQTDEALRSLGIDQSFKGRLDIATDSRGVIDHVLSGQADAGIIYGHEAVKEQERLRVVTAVEKGYTSTLHSMAMERYCPNRRLCDEFLTFIQSAEARAVVRQAGYAVPPNAR